MTDHQLMNLARRLKQVAQVDPTADQRTINMCIMCVVDVLKYSGTARGRQLATNFRDAAGIETTDPGQPD